MSVPQISSTAQTMSQGRRGSHISPVETGFTGLGAGIEAADSSLVRNAADNHNSFGCHTFRNRMRHAIETNDAPMSTIHGLMKFEIKNCGIAKDTPVTRTAGHTPFT